GHLVDAEHLECRAGADDVDDRVDRAHLVEVDLLAGLAVEPALGLGERGEHGPGPVAHPVGKGGLVEHGEDVGSGAHDVGGLGDDVGLRAADAVAEHAFGVESPAAHREPLADGPHLGEVGAPGEERSARHAAGHAADAVEPGDPAPGPAPAVAAHARAARGSMRETAIAAPNPLSIPTTVMPAAQLASMPSSAVTPSRPAP